MYEILVPPWTNWPATPTSFHKKRIAHQPHASAHRSSPASLDRGNLADQCNIFVRRSAVG